MLGKFELYTLTYCLAVVLISILRNEKIFKFTCWATGAVNSVALPEGRSGVGAEGPTVGAQPRPRGGFLANMKQGATHSYPGRFRHKNESGGSTPDPGRLRQECSWLHVYCAMKRFLSLPSGHRVKFRGKVQKVF